MKRLFDYIKSRKKNKNVDDALVPDGKEHGFDYVDLGLPSGTMWATCNVGADKPEEDGLLFQFGFTDGYKYGDKNNDFYKAFGKNNKEFPTYNAGDILKLEDDAAHVNMGGKWRMPTKDDLFELYWNTKRKSTKVNGKNGVLFTSKINGKSIFVTLAGWWDYGRDQFFASWLDGYIRSSEVYSRDNNESLSIKMDLYDSGAVITPCALANGYSVRGVFKK